MLFYILSVLITVLHAIIFLPLYLILPMSLKIKFSTYGINVILFLCKVTDKIDYEIRGYENLPSDVPYIIASEHQSPLETLILFTIFKNPAYILKKELKHFPILGIYFRLLKMTFINREHKIQAIKHILSSTESHIKEGRTVIIFPQGSRIIPGEKINIKSGIIAIYNQLSIPIVPVAVNTGLFWPASILSSKKRHGKAVIQILPPIYPGLSKEEFANELETRISSASNLLIKEALQQTAQ